MESRRYIHVRPISPHITVLGTSPPELVVTELPRQVSSQRPAPPTSASVHTGPLVITSGPSSTRLSPINLQPCVFLPVNPTPNQPPGNIADAEIKHHPGRRLETTLRPARVDTEDGRRRRPAPETPAHHSPELQPGAYRRGIIEASSPPAGPLPNLSSVSFVEPIAPGPARRRRQATVNWRPPRNCSYFTDFVTPTRPSQPEPLSSHVWAFIIGVV